MAVIARLKKCMRLPAVCPTPHVSMPSCAQYPAIGLLLNREFYTFIENKETRELKPAEPLVRELTNFGIKEDDGTKKQYHETLVMRVTVPSHSQSWGINICPEDHHDFREVLFHFNPRRRFVAMNNRVDKVWGQQVRIK